MVSQFISPHQVNLLGDINFNFPDGTHAIGRLDINSEGLLLLTTNKKITRLLFSSGEKHRRTYLVQLNNILSENNLQRLRNGVTIRIKGDVMYTTPVCEVELVHDPDSLCQYSTQTGKDPGSHTWILISLTEGKFRQVRKMIAAVRHRCKRLIRVAIEDILLERLAPGEVKEMDEKDFFEKLKIKAGKQQAIKGKILPLVAPVKN